MREEQLLVSLSESAALRASLAQSEAERERLQGEMDFFEQLSKSKLPCGHLSRYGFTDDGGKTGYCTLCELAREMELNQCLRQVVKEYREQCMNGMLTDCDTCQRADVLLEDKAKPVATNAGEEK